MTLVAQLLNLLGWAHSRGPAKHLVEGGQDLVKCLQVAKQFGEGSNQLAAAQEGLASTARVLAAEEEHCFVASWMPPVSAEEAVHAAENCCHHPSSCLER